MVSEAPPLRAELLAAGLLVETGVNGLYARSGDFERIVDGLAGMVTRAAAADRPAVLRFPPVFPRAAFERTDYIRSFPDLTGGITTFVGGDRDHARLLGLVEDGADWAAALTPSELMLCSATCHPLYPTLAGRLPAGGRLIDLHGWCFRHEPSLDPARMQAFRQHELVFVGEPELAVAHRDRWVERAQNLCSELGLAVEAEVANDPFFGRAGRVLAVAQRDEALKIELTIPVANEAPTAVVSSNCHREHFGEAFGISTADGDVAHSACVGFGVERMTLALLASHGLDPDAWSAPVRAVLWP